MSIKIPELEQLPYQFPYTCIVHKPDPAVEYYEAYKNIGRKYNRIASGEFASPVLQEAINNLCIDNPNKAGWKYMKGSICIKDDLLLKAPIDLTKKDHIHIFGSKAGGRLGFGTRIIIGHNGIGLDLTGSRWFLLENLQFEVEDYTPPCVLLLSRETSGADTFEGVIRQCSFIDYGKPLYADIYMYGGDLGKIVNCNFFSKKYPIIITGNNIFDVSSPFQTVATGFQCCASNVIVDSQFYINYGEYLPIILESSGCVFERNYFGGNRDKYAVKHDQKTGAGSVLIQLIFKDNIFESRPLTMRVTPDNSMTIYGFIFEGNYVECNATAPVIDLAHVEASSLDTLRGAYIRSNKWCHANSRPYKLQFYDVRFAEIDLFDHSSDSECISLQIDGTLADSRIWTFDATKLSIANKLRVDFLGQKFNTSGTATFSGTGAQTVFTIAHNLALPPTNVNLEAKTADASGVKYWSADGTNITVTFITAPPAGTDNVVIGWKGEV